MTSHPYPQIPYPMMEPEPPQKKNHPVIIIALIVTICVLLFGIGFGLAMFFHPSGKNESTQEKTMTVSSSGDEKKDLKSKRSRRSAKKYLKDNIRHFDFSNASWPVWTHSATSGHGSRFSMTGQMRNGNYTSEEPGNPVVHCFNYLDNHPTVYADINNDGYEDAMTPVIGTRNDNCAYGEKAFIYLIVWVWDPKASTARFLSEPAIDLQYKLMDSLNYEGVDGGFKINLDYHDASGTQYTEAKTIGVASAHALARVDDVDGWGGMCVPLKNSIESGTVGETFSTARYTPKNDSPELPNWKQGGKWMKMTLVPQKVDGLARVDDGYSLIRYQPEGGSDNPEQWPCAWVK
ncbi:MAG: hypothetical protein Q4P66_04975 [Actinomycetaceae bacterium]|nr:hypothetical protein [Actinomycetaceae bacterium]MDO5746994.1 hypothetical protein [Actinomycetaceae bacterium]